MACLPVFPNKSSIPPVCFYNIQGLPIWLNQHPEYKQYFIGTYPYLNSTTSTLSSLKYDVKNVPLGSNLTALSQGQSLLYNQQLQLFHKVYSTNLNAYTINYNNDGPGPIYYNFKDYQELTQYKSAVSLVNKLYPFKAMAEASTLHWQVPFPIYM